MKKFYFDLETTGLDAVKHGIWQLSGILDIDGEVVDEFSWEFQPAQGKMVSPEALDISRISIEDLRLLPLPSEFHRQLCDKLSLRINKFDKKDKAFIYAYNAGFDYQFMRQWFTDMGNKYFGSWFWHPYVDIMTKAGLILLPRRHELENFKLGTVCRAAGIEFDDECGHDSFYDIRKGRELDLKLNELIGLKV